MNKVSEGPNARAITVLGFDYGTRHIGVAVGQSVTGTATALTTLSLVNGKPDWTGIQRLLAQWRPDMVVVGEPLNMDGSEQDMTRRARRFANQLRGRFAIEVQGCDERLSTRAARERLWADGPAGNLRGARSPRNEVDHDIAAQVIVETWLNAQAAPDREVSRTNDLPEERT